MRLQDVAIIGASGLIGRKILQLLHDRNFPLGRVIPIASENSEGKILSFGGKNLKCEILTEEIFKGIELAFFSAGASVSNKWVPEAVKSGCLVIDNSSAFRMDIDVPLVVPEVNRKDIFKHKGIIANPNCSTIQLVMILKPLHDLYKINRVVVSTYQSVAGSGYKGINALNNELKGIQDVKSPFAHQIAFNALPHVDVFFDDGYTKEEHKMVHETRKIMCVKDLKITSTCVRIPTIGGHSESVNLEFDKKFDLNEVREALSKFPGVVVEDDPVNNKYPMPISSEDKDEVFVGRIRRDESIKNGLNLWIVSDSVRKGGALNAVQVAEEFLKGK